MIRLFETIAEVYPYFQYHTRSSAAPDEDAGRGGEGYRQVSATVRKELFNLKSYNKPFEALFIPRFIAFGCTSCQKTG